MRKKAKPAVKQEEAHIEGEVVIEETPVTEEQAVSEIPESPPMKWLSLTAYAPLQITQTANFLRYGSRGVRRFGPGASVEVAPHTHTITIKLTLKQATDQVLLTCDQLTLNNPHPEQAFDLEGTNLWVGSIENRHLQITWVWDFYRLYSGIRLSVAFPPEDAPDVWQQASQALRNLQAGDQIIVEAESRSGNILQIYPIDSTAFEATSDAPTS